MIKIIVGPNTNTKEVIISPERTPRQILEEQGINYSVGGISLDGISIGGPKLDETFGQLGVKEKAYLISTVKADAGK